MDHELMEEKLAAASVDYLRSWPAYHALTYGWLLSGLARSVTGMGMGRCGGRPQWHCPRVAFTEGTVTDASGALVATASSTLLVIDLAHQARI